MAVNLPRHVTFDLLDLEIIVNGLHARCAVDHQQMKEFAAGVDHEIAVVAGFDRRRNAEDVPRRSTEPGFAKRLVENPALLCIDAIRRSVDELDAPLAVLLTTNANASIALHNFFVFMFPSFLNFPPKSNYAFCVSIVSRSPGSNSTFYLPSHESVHSGFSTYII